MPEVTAPTVADEPGEVDGTGGAGEVDPVPPPQPTRADDGALAEQADGPQVRVHRGRLERRVAPMELSPTEALRLAEEGRTGLSRRELPPDVEGDDPGGSGDADPD